MCRSRQGKSATSLCFLQKTRERCSCTFGCNLRAFSASVECCPALWFRPARLHRCTHVRNPGSHGYFLLLKKVDFSKDSKYISCSSCPGVRTKDACVLKYTYFRLLRYKWRQESAYICSVYLFNRSDGQSRWSFQWVMELTVFWLMVCSSVSALRKNQTTWCWHQTAADWWRCQFLASATPVRPADFSDL